MLECMPEASVVYHLEELRYLIIGVFILEHENFIGHLDKMLDLRSDDSANRSIGDLAAGHTEQTRM